MEAPKLDLIVVDKPGSPEEVVRLTDPDTGEMVLLADAPQELIARVLGRTELAIQDHLHYLRNAKDILGAEMLSRMDDNAEWTASSRGVKVSAPSPTAGTTSWDAEALHNVLDDLVKAKVITKAAALRACKVNVEHVPVVAGIKALLKNPKAAPAVLTAQRTSAAPRRKVTVKITDAGEL